MPFPGSTVAARKCGLLRSAAWGRTSVTAGSPPIKIGAPFVVIPSPILIVLALDLRPGDACTEMRATARNTKVMIAGFRIEASVSRQRKRFLEKRFLLRLPGQRFSRTLYWYSCLGGKDFFKTFASSDRNKPSCPPSEMVTPPRLRAKRGAVRGPPFLRPRAKRS